MTLVDVTPTGAGTDDLGLAPGTVVRCTTCYDVEIRGEVAAFDLHQRALIIVSPPAAGSQQTRDTVHMVNISNLKHLSVDKEATGKDEPFESLDNNKLTRRVQDNVQEKMRKINAIGVGVTPEAQSLFNSITKTIEDVKWDGKTIVVLKDVSITEPYTEKDLQIISGRTSSSFDHISKIVRKHYEDMQRPGSGT